MSNMRVPEIQEFPKKCLLKELRNETPLDRPVHTESRPELDDGLTRVFKVNP